MSVYKRSHMCGELRETDIGQDVVLNGWIQKRRNLGGLIFCDLRDKTGITQIVFNDKISRCWPTISSYIPQLILRLSISKMMTMWMTT